MSEAERLTRLEERYLHLQNHVAAQDKAMLDLSDEISRLRQELAVLRAQVQPGAGNEESAPGEERPPHY